ncbi:pogo transposable element with KRAB domain [Rhizophagus clarus]|uniref:Pogo transposable element with KRAB domain n=2 Tax=Rhizophagus clarus TaxID=94130 RepID=A0A8H3M2R4_9GLOM|nr:pogo transposable element with KRAB domain [Rhizophagus clarus]
MNEILVWFDMAGWMDSELINWYIDYLGDETNKRNEAGAPKFDLGVILDSVTSLYQPLDVIINKPFKANLCKEWHLWMAADGIFDEIIIDSFKTCGISNTLNDIEDFDNEIIDISDNDLENGINDDLENNGSDDNLEDNISCDDLDIGINE